MGVVSREPLSLTSAACKVMERIALDSIIMRIHIAHLIQDDLIAP